jgi:hypothetical protein
MGLLHPPSHYRLPYFGCTRGTRSTSQQVREDTARQGQYRPQSPSTSPPLMTTRLFWLRFCNQFEPQHRSVRRLSSVPHHSCQAQENGGLRIDTLCINDSRPSYNPPHRLSSWGVVLHLHPSTPLRLSSSMRCDPGFTETIVRPSFRIVY